ncbi:hypothetical protein TcWFU_003932 [Taenia crassiceps]|uniref:DUF5734 domain-containing protein n=1 Tax=Taenia crassiceps TaxID=6207 RepID=A0ABR4Q1I8_9CEST
MAPLLSTTATCVCCNAPLEGKSLKDVAEHALQESENPPSYKVKLTKSKVSFKPASKGARKMKPIELQKVDDTYVIEKSDVIAFSVTAKKKPACLALKFSDPNSRKEFQTLSKSSISNAKKSKKDKKKKKKKSKSTKSEQDKASKEKKPDSTLESPHGRPSSSTITLSDVKAPQQSYQTSSPRGSLDEGRRSALSPSTKDAFSVCSHCHQKLPKRIVASKVEYNPPNYLPLRSSRPRARSYDSSLNGGNGSVCYIGPRSPSRKSRRPSSKARNRVPRHSSHTRGSSIDPLTDEGDGSSSTSTTLSPTDGRFIKVGAVTLRTPVPQRRSPRSKTRGRYPQRSKSQPIVYYIWDSSGEEEDESDDYDSTSTSMDGSSSSYYDGPGHESYRSKKIDKLLRELGKPGAIRLY